MLVIFLSCISALKHKFPVWDLYRTSYLIWVCFCVYVCVPVCVCVCVCTLEHSLLVPSPLQDLYEVYIRELDEGNLDRAVALDKVTIGQPTRVPVL